MAELKLADLKVDTKACGGGRHHVTGTNPLCDCLMAGAVREVVRRDWRPDLDRVPDDHLRAEGDRRTVSFWYGPGAAEVIRKLEVERDDLKRTIERERDALAVEALFRKNVTADRDEWRRLKEIADHNLDVFRRRAEAAEKALAIARGHRPWPLGDVESGPGIAATHSPPRDDGHYVDPWDFLEDE